jgi:hypothetical protein
MVEPQPSKLMTRVRFPLPAPYMNKEDKKELRKLKKLMNIKPPKLVFKFDDHIASDYIRSKLREKSCAEHLFPSVKVN